jgi:hypothetical protein
MKSFFKWALVTYVSCLFVGCQKDLRQVNASASLGNSTQRIEPNIIFILADDVGYQIPTCDCGRSYSTPNIDRLANTGMRFTQCRAAPLCSPSRFMILTGK